MLKPQPTSLKNKAIESSAISKENGQNDQVKGITQKISLKSNETIQAIISKPSNYILEKIEII